MAERLLRLTFLVTATSHSPPWRTWKNVVLPSVMSGLVGGVELAMTWILKMSEMDRLHSYTACVSSWRAGHRAAGDALEVGPEQARDEHLALDVQDEAVGRAEPCQRERASGQPGACSQGGDHGALLARLNLTRALRLARCLVEWERWGGLEGP